MLKVGDKVKLTDANWDKLNMKDHVVSVVHVYYSYTQGVFLGPRGNRLWFTLNKNSGWHAELVETEQEEVGEMTRLPRDRKGKTPIDVGIVKQDGLERVRLSMGEDGTPGRKNSDLSLEETQDLIAMLNYNMLVIKGEIERDGA